MTAPLFQLLVFCSEQALGNPTAVVLLERELIRQDYLQIAASLALPDTAFLFPPDAEGRVPVRVFSPTEELSLCTQALIAAHRVLESRGGNTTTRFLAAVGEIPVTSSGDIAWLVGNYNVLIEQLKPRELPGAHRSSRIDCGRIRSYFQMKNENAFTAVDLAPEAVMLWCRKEAISGICPLVRDREPRVVRLRVFTTSQDGREDIATGGACLGIPAFFGETTDAEWRIEQGIGEDRRRGTLFAKRLSDRTAAVGGRHRVVARGELLVK